MGEAVAEASSNGKPAKAVSIWNFRSLFVTKEAYKQVSSEFQPFHQHDLNVFLHLLTTGLGLWGVLQGAHLVGGIFGDVLVALYAVMVQFSTPLSIGWIHSVMVAGMMMVEARSWQQCVGAIVLGYGLQDVAHWLTVEKTYMGSYIASNPLALLSHNLFLLSLVIEGVLARHCFLPWFVHRDRTIFTTVKSKDALVQIRKWISTNVPETPETTHVWPHKQEGTDAAATALENDEAIFAAFRTVFAKRHFDVEPILGMNEIYVTAVGAKKAINSDAVFYTPHNDGPFWFLPGASVYRVMVGITPNRMVRTNFNLQHVSCTKVMNMYEVLGFDYNRELHWIDHTDEKNEERRSVMKLHYVVYPRGWKMYGNLVAYLNTTYNTWARNNFLRTLRPDSVFAVVNAWWIWLMTYFNAMAELHVGWINLVYIGTAYALGPTAFFVLTSYRHYVHYITTYAYRTPRVAQGFFFRDTRMSKMTSLFHQLNLLLPHVDWMRDLPAITAIIAGYAVTILATVQIGLVRAYFGSELGFVKPQWVDAFPYGTIPHPMILGQVFAFCMVLAWWWPVLSTFTKLAFSGHIVGFLVPMIQEMLDSSYS